MQIELIKQVADFLGDGYTVTPGSYSYGPVYRSYVYKKRRYWFSKEIAYIDNNERIVSSDKDFLELIEAAFPDTILKLVQR